MSGGPPRRSRLRIGAALGLAAAIVAGSIGLAEWRGPRRFEEVVPGALYRSAQLEPEELAEVVRRHGIRTVVNLRSENEMSQGDWHAREALVLGSLGVRLVDLPMNTGFPPRDEVLDGWLELIGDEAAAPLLVHCEYGVVRTGIMVALYEIERRGRGVAEALARSRLPERELPPEIDARIDDYFASYVPRRSS